ncbi:MAG: co-chaperone GroES [Phycisphaeraceae bacterium]|nr:co-chaperone GroES [Phycisphaeraceae bacterium]
MATATKPKPSSTNKKSSNASLRPLGPRVLILRDEAQTKTDSGLYLPETAKDKPKTGTVQSVGDGALNHDTGERIPLTVKPGDKVLFSSYAGTEVKLDGVDMLIMEESEILGIID